MLKQTNKLIKFTRLKKNYYQSINSNNDKNLKSIFKTFVSNASEIISTKLNNNNDKIIYRGLNHIFNKIKETKSMVINEYTEAKNTGEISTLVLNFTFLPSYVFCSLFFKDGGNCGHIALFY